MSRNIELCEAISNANVDLEGNNGTLGIEMQSVNMFKNRSHQNIPEIEAHIDFIGEQMKTEKKSALL